VRHQVRKAVGAASDARFAVATGRSEAAGESAHSPDEVELAVELEYQPAQRRFGSPRPRAGGVGPEANLYGHVLDNIRPLNPLPAPAV
jgi:hypothetical protein